jgi:soluble lytic murein transglycosylase-like protein
MSQLLVVHEEGSDAPVYPNIENFLESSNSALALYREEVTRSSVVDFFVLEAGSEAVALPILYYADKFDISLTLAFSLAWVESRYEVDAVNVNSGSIDRGLFQLNSRTFRDLSVTDFFTPEVNAFHGLKYLEFCLAYGDNDAQALAIYNAGLRRVVAGNTPPATRVHVQRILERRKQIQDEFRSYILSHFPPSLA